MINLIIAFAFAAVIYICLSTVFIVIRLEGWDTEGGIRHDEHSYTFVYEQWAMGATQAVDLQWLTNIRVRLLPRRQDTLANKNTKYWVHALLVEITPPTEVVWHQSASHFDADTAVCACAPFLTKITRYKLHFNSMFVVLGKLNWHMTWICIAMKLHFSDFLLPCFSFAAGSI